MISTLEEAFEILQTDAKYEKMSELVDFYQKNKNKDLLNSLLNANDKLLNSILKAYKTNYNYDDLKQEGRIALLLSIKQYDFSQGYKFSTYAGFAIKRRIYRYLYEDNLVKVPSDILKLIRKVN